MSAEGTTRARVSVESAARVHEVRDARRGSGAGRQMASREREGGRAARSCAESCVGVSACSFRNRRAASARNLLMNEFVQTTYRSAVLTRSGLHKVRAARWSRHAAQEEAEREGPRGSRRGLDERRRCFREPELRAPEAGPRRYHHARRERRLGLRDARRLSWREPSAPRQLHAAMDRVAGTPAAHGRGAGGRGRARGGRVRRLLRRLSLTVVGLQHYSGIVSRKNSWPWSGSREPVRQKRYPRGQPEPRAGRTHSRPRPCCCAAAGPRRRATRRRGVHDGRHEQVPAARHGALLRRAREQTDAPPAAAEPGAFWGGTGGSPALARPGDVPGGGRRARGVRGRERG